MGLKLHPALFVHPGEWLKSEIVEPNGASVSGLAAAFGVSRQAVSALLNGRARLTAEMAIRFEKLFGIDAETMMRMQVSYDLAQLHNAPIKVDASRLAA